MTQFIFFSGKGGVGKTSMACAHAVRYADLGKRTLIVTTDPASNLADVFDQEIGHHVTPIAGVPHLSAMEIDPDKATQEYIDRAMAPIRAAFPPQIVQVMEEQMSGPCTAEVAAFDRFTDFLDVPANDGVSFDTVIFDTAPTGHTIRLLELPAEWSQSIDAASAGSGQTCLGPAAAIQDAKHKYERALSAMRQSEQTRFVFVLHPEAISIKETRRAIDELIKLDIENFGLIVNGIIPREGIRNPLFAARAKMQARYSTQIESDFPYPKQRMILLAEEIKGVRKLREVGKIFFDGEAAVQVDESVDVQLQDESFASSLDLVRTLVEPHGRPLRILAVVGLAGALAAPCEALAAQALDSTGMPSLEQLALEAGRASRRHPVASVAPAFLCEPTHPLMDSASVAACAALDSVKAAAITAAFARGLEVPVAATSGDSAALGLPVCPPDLDRVNGGRVLPARLTAPVAGVRDGIWEGRLLMEVRCRSGPARGGEAIRTMGKEYLYQWIGGTWRLYQFAWRGTAR